jgi:predicted phosphate transport protein (TIGR00153 family)
MRLIPRQEKFFRLFLDQASTLVKCSTLLLDAARRGNSALAARADEIKALEERADATIHDIVDKLRQTFLTPLDPDDIHRLASRLDDVIDGIEDAAHRMAAHGLEPVPPAVIRLCEVTKACAEEIEKALSALEKDETVTVHCIEINRLENEADNVYRDAVAQLFRTEKDPIALLRQLEILELLEETIDRTEDVADVLQNVVLKNA